MKKSLIAAILVMSSSAAAFAQAPAAKHVKKVKAKTEKQATDSVKTVKHHVKHAAAAKKA